MNERKHTLEVLLDFERPLEQIKTALAAFSWDAETELAFLSVGHVASILKRFVNGLIPPLEVQDWANAIEGRDDIGLESRNEQLSRELVHELANPLITQPLTQARALELLKKMSSVSGAIWQS